MIRDRFGQRSASTVIACVALLAALGGGGTLAAANIGGSSPAVAATQYLNISAPTFVPVADSTHNNSGSSVCGSFVASEQGSENKGDLNARKGSFMAPVELPDGATVNELSIYANDNDGDGDVHAFLVRKLVKDGLTPQFTNYLVMATAASNGAVLNTMRKFSDVSIAQPLVNNLRFEYYVEMVNCAVTEPFSVQLGLSVGQP
jgi:hypothetical protein